ncbi:hypothetical protein [Runella sp.]|uniref:hypothetical protein n=1 Tax=Runella sp. TaxID=1960881 RepID=UPI003D142B79
MMDYNKPYTVNGGDFHFKPEDNSFYLREAVDYTDRSIIIAEADLQAFARLLKVELDFQKIYDAAKLQLLNMKFDVFERMLNENNIKYTYFYWRESSPGDYN